ncbi:hypothetical protein PF005_g14347 [Phytophthora fragariae]|uniref:Uncharacterized protein n=1 Tax=Phytophthora fragariae TaxID=53985 RepID=A0A6A3ELH1_9STRA|nr:hypothetical protein PF009_g15703 [Phytophthora fragariae]KAE9140149.1 hypothetical protein PF006_g13589 [Phytophthora fragariae]KAE9203049.1 hypothetical protein PF005_g14347 [Phytophthora fragariae]KAE9220321.1 hypothetical protein PF002_g15927 [Phytophthora fragariae]KAE9302814.1 hypothetical protein PF001_g13842 [Phytophthora fragariae]
MPTGWTLNLSRSLSLSLTEPCNWGTEDIDRPTTSDAAMRRTTKAVPLSALGLRLARPNCWNVCLFCIFPATVSGSTDYSTGRWLSVGLSPARSQLEDRLG